MGVDPGLVATGFGVLEADGGGVTVRDAGVISTTTGQPLEARLNALHRAVHRIIELQSPGLLVVEDLYTEYKFPRTAILMGHARGVIYLAARQLGVAVIALAPSEVKRAMTGNGAAGKAQVQRAVQTVLGLKELPRPSHVADALGLAATGMSRMTGKLPTPVGDDSEVDMSACKLLNFRGDCFCHCVYGVCAHCVSAIYVQVDDEHLPCGCVDDSGV